MPKLKGYMHQLARKSISTVFIAGGAASNLLQAAANLLPADGFRVIGLIRGNDKAVMASPLVKSLSRSGMELIFLDAAIYRSINQAPESVFEYLPSFARLKDQSYFIPEGAYGPLALPGVIEAAQVWLNQIQDSQTIVVPMGTGATLAGIGLAVAQHWLDIPQKCPQVIGYAPFKDQAYVASLPQVLIDKSDLPDQVKKLASLCTSAVAVGNLGRYGKPIPAVQELAAALGLNAQYAGFAWAAHLQENPDQVLQSVLVDTGGHWPAPT